MAFSAHRDTEDIKEYSESPTSIDKKARQLAELIRKSKHFIAFTGAGISTSAGINDFRGPNGKWTLAAQGKSLKINKNVALIARPTQTHMSLVALEQAGRLKRLVSQNCDGLHRRSGFPKTQLSELHGNSNLEVCQRCGTEYLRDFRAVASHEKTVYNHRTGRKCAMCKGDLHDTLVHFGEDLPAEPMDLAMEHAAKADLCLVLGSSVTVQPANEIPTTLGKKRGAKLVICNLQPTPLDDEASLRVWAKTDELMEKVMGYLSLPIPPFVLRRRLRVQVQGKTSGGYRVVAEGLDVDGTPASFLQSVKVGRRVLRAEPFTFESRDDLAPGTETTLLLQFMGHYVEPDLELVHKYEVPEDGQAEFWLSFELATASWATERQSTTS
jgi:NAD-dependent SIR2 family protein deacetylase